MDTCASVLHNMLKSALVTELALALLDPDVAWAFVSKSTLFFEFTRTGAVPATTDLLFLTFTFRC